jgi:hypothetical protein
MEFLKVKHWQKDLDESLMKLISADVIDFKTLKPSSVPKQAGVYLITEKDTSNEHVPLWVGRSKNLRQRLYNNHLMGDKSGARLRYFMCKDVDHTCFNDWKKSKEHLRASCFVRFIFEADMRKRYALESYFTAMIYPKYGLTIEH